MQTLEVKSITEEVKLGFYETWKKWIKEYLSTVSVSVLVNGSPTEEFAMGRCLRKGDPLSHFLFLLEAEEGLSIMINKATVLGRFQGFKIGELGLEISHLQYADDTLIIEEPSRQKCMVH